MHILTWVIELDKQDKLLDKVSQKTHVSKEDILSLANDLQTKDLKDEQNIRDFVQKISQLTHKQVKQMCIRDRSYVDLSHYQYSRIVFVSIYSFDDQTTNGFTKYLCFLSLYAFDWYFHYYNWFNHAKGD